MSAPYPQLVDAFIAAQCGEHIGHGWVFSGDVLKCGCGEPLARYTSSRVLDNRATQEGPKP